MITELTQEQKDLIPQYVEKWTKINLNAQPIDKDKAREIINNLHHQVFDEKSEPICIFADSPYSAWKVSCYIYNNNYFKTPEKESKLQDEVNQVLSETNKNAIKEPFVYPYLDGAFSASYFANYDYCENALGIDLNNIKGWKEYKDTNQLSLIYPLDNIYILSDHPQEIHIRDGRLHKDGAPAILYRDSFEVHCLNGIKVSKEVAELPFDKLDPIKHIIEESNVEVRKEVIKKMGIERFIDKVGAKIIDEWGDYTLLKLELPKILSTPAIYLKMKNPTVGCWHVEGVPPHITTVREALEKGRCRSAIWNPKQLT